MSEGRRRTRPWGPLRGSSGPAHELAHLLRAWLDKAELRVTDLACALQPEHFTDGRVPARTTVAERLAGANPQWDFVEAVADVCSRDDAERTRMLNDARPLWERVRAALPQRNGRTGQRSRRPDDVRRDDTSPGQPDPTADEALRSALRRAAEAERERDNAHQLSVLLLTTVNRLGNDLTELRARLRTGGGVPTDQLRRARRRLQRSEARRALLMQELRQARAERDNLRGAASSGDEDRTTCDAPRTGPPDNRPDNCPLTTVRLLADARAHGREAVARRIAAAAGRDGNPGFVQRVVALLYANEQPADAARVLASVARGRPAARVPGVLSALLRAGRHLDASHVRASVARAESAERVLDVVAALREAGLHSDAYQVLAAAGRLRALGDVPPLVRSLTAAGRPDDAHWLLGFAGRERPRTEARALAEVLRLAGDPAAADLLLSELRPPTTPTPQPSTDNPPPLPIPTRPLPPQTTGLATVIHIDPSPGARAPVLGRRVTDGPYVERVPPPRG